MGLVQITGCLRSQPKLNLEGSKDKMNVYGMDSHEFSKELKRLNIQKILDDREKAKEKAKDETFKLLVEALEQKIEKLEKRVKKLEKK